MMPKLHRRSVYILAALTCLSGAAACVFGEQVPVGESYGASVKNTCGPDALSAALAKFNIDASPLKIAQLAGSDVEGTTMLGLKQAAESLGTKATGVRLSQEELESHLKHGASIIAFVNQNHFVWVKEIRRQGVLVKDATSEFQIIPFEKWHSMWFEAKDGNTPLSQEGLGLCLVLYPKASTR